MTQLISVWRTLNVAAERMVLGFDDSPIGLVEPLDVRHGRTDLWLLRATFSFAAEERDPVTTCHMDYPTSAMCYFLGVLIIAAAFVLRRKLSSK